MTESENLVFSVSIFPEFSLKGNVEAINSLKGDVEVNGPVFGEVEVIEL